MNLMRWILRALQAFWRSATFCGTVIGLLYLWPDIQSLPEQYDLKWEFPMRLDREAITLLFLGAAMVWIVWMDIRPWVRAWIEKRRREPCLEVFSGNDFPCSQVDILRDERGGYYTRATNRIGVTNHTGKTLHSVKLRLEKISPHNKTSLSIDPHLPAPMRPFNKPKGGHVTLHDGETEYWDIAKHIDTEDDEKNRIFICCLDESKRHNIQSGLYKITLAIYSEVWPKHEESFVMIGDSLFMLMAWNKWAERRACAIVAPAINHLDGPTDTQSH
jgi:hypothetical protein